MRYAFDDFVIGEELEDDHESNHQTAQYSKSRGVPQSVQLGGE